MSLIHGEIYQAFRYNMILFLDVPILMLLYIIDLKKGKNKKAKRAINTVVFVLLIITLLFGILRNIPAFNFLAPTAV